MGLSQHGVVAVLCPGAFLYILHLFSPVEQTTGSSTEQRYGSVTTGTRPCCGNHSMDQRALSFRGPRNSRSSTGLFHASVRCLARIRFQERLRADLCGTSFSL